MKRTTTKTTVEEYDDSQNLVRREITEETVEENESTTTPYMPYTPWKQLPPYTPWISGGYGGHIRKIDPSEYTVNFHTTVVNPNRDGVVADLQKAVNRSMIYKD